VVGRREERVSRAGKESEGHAEVAKCARADKDREKRERSLMKDRGGGHNSKRSACRISFSSVGKADERQAETVARDTE